MTTNLVSVRPDDEAARIRVIFEKNDFHHLPVVEPGERLVGIISKADYLKIVYVLSFQNKCKKGIDNTCPTICAADFMTKCPMQLEPDDTIGLAADIFLANKFHALPVVEDERLVGIVTTHDLLKYSFTAVMEPLEEEVYVE